LSLNPFVEVSKASTSLLFFIKYSQVIREQQSTKNTKYQNSLKVVVGHRPHTSECTNSKHQSSYY
jgi:hypothetical protein